MVISPTPAQLTTPATSNFARTKYFPIEVYCANMIPNTTYDAYVDGQLINAFCKPYAGKLGGPLTSDNTGRLRFQYMFAVQYNQNYLVNPIANNNLVQSSKTITMVDPFNHSSTSTIPLLFKSGS